jgi:hypothetical protein
MTKKMPSANFLIFLTCALLFPASSSAQRGARTMPRSLDQMSQQAETIVHGYVLSTKVEPHPQLNNLTTVLVSMKVTTMLKGKSQETLQFRQYIWDVRDKFGAAEYQKGQELLLMLGPVSQYGLTSPVGLEQGRFRITHDGNGRAMAVNGRGNAGLFQASEQRAQLQKLRLSARTTALIRQSQAGPVPLADLKEAIRSFAGVK